MKTIFTGILLAILLGMGSPAWAKQCPDWNNDGWVNFKELQEFWIYYVGKIYNPKMDLNQDGELDAQDLEILREFFFQRCPTQTP